MKKCLLTAAAVFFAAVIGFGLTSCTPALGKDDNSTELVLEIKEPNISGYEGLTFIPPEEITSIVIKLIQDGEIVKEETITAPKTVSFKGIEPGKYTVDIRAYKGDQEIAFTTGESDISKNTKGTTDYLLGYIPVILENDGKSNGLSKDEVIIFPVTSIDNKKIYLPNRKDDMIKTNPDFLLKEKGLECWQDESGTKYDAGSEIDLTGKQLPLKLKAVWKTYIGNIIPESRLLAGSILFNDGSSVNYPYCMDNELTQEMKDNAVALIVENVKQPEYQYPQALGVALNHSENTCRWCTREAAAYEKDIETIHCEVKSSTMNNYTSYSYTGVTDFDGSDNLNQIRDFLGAEDDVGFDSKYPAFYYAINYGTNTQNMGDLYIDGWYLPTLYEMTLIKKNRNILDDLFKALGYEGFPNEFYWTSSQSYHDPALKNQEDIDKSAVSFSFKNASFRKEIDNDSKSSDDENYVLPVRLFNSYMD